MHLFLSSIQKLCAFILDSFYFVCKIKCICTLKLILYNKPLVWYQQQILPAYFVVSAFRMCPLNITVIDIEFIEFSKVKQYYTYCFQANNVKFFKNPKFVGIE